ncbi:alkaline phosphatase [Geminocystis sp. NIES-3708]|uniref:peptidylprolyl isomerase n=1 Tax=Geminocystis sp. NIES-3708 TaxID=1615909 RepID=UPI0005FC688A|nr:peptidylprolyl isomerase [Geminocystis sp. NIES-3708]BAQ61963.1 alkaline phosphatase [Geminocystis sp. NIES-3708]
MSINVNSLNPIVVNINSNDTTVNLFQNFDDPFTTGKVANFDLRENSIGAGEINIVLFDQPGQGAPITVNNFIKYANDGDYINTIIHRSIANFIIQGGGFTVNNLRVGNVPADAPIVNEFSPNRSNTRGTIAMAKLGNNPNSATNQWFFNLGNNASNLDNQNGGFTVFGQVLPGNNLTTIDAIASLPVVNGSNINAAFTDLPVNIFNVDVNNIQINEDDDFVRFEDIFINNLPELTFTVENNTNPNLVSARIDENGRLKLNYFNNIQGVADITVKATNLLGESTTDTLRVSVVNNPSLPSGNLNTSFNRFQNKNLPGTYLFASEIESRNIRASFPNFVEEGVAFQVSETPDDGLIVFNRFQNKNLPGTYLYAGEKESQGIRQNFPNFVEEGIAFYAYGGDANKGVDFYRFQNTQQPGTYIFVGEQERQNILANFPNFVEEGVAFEVRV